jgi:hypothetical protein
MPVSEQSKLEQEKELSTLVSIEDELARTRGHDPIWTYGEDNGDQIARAECRGCGVSMAARVFADGRAWSAGRLRVARDCEGGGS